MLTQPGSFAMIQSAMTDIRQHLPVILTSLRQSLAQEETPAAWLARLRALLPASYGLGAGQLVNAQGQLSALLDVIIYDTTINPTRPTTEPYYDLRQALAVIVLAGELATADLKGLLQTIADVKLLRHRLSPEQNQITSLYTGPGRSSGQSQQRATLKKLLPLGIVASRRLLAIQSDTPEALALLLDTLLKEQPEQLRPDYLLAGALTYRNPLLDGGSFGTSTVNIAREPALAKPRSCYVCKQAFRHAHFFYHALCVPCGDFNYQKRRIPGHFAGRTALVTGGRVKIGYATALRLLRAGMQVIVTTRFPHDAATRYSSEADFADWQDRLHIYGLDFRYLSVLEQFVAHLSSTYSGLDVLINNAAQTVRRPLDYYAHLLAREQAPPSILTPAQQALVERSHASLPRTPFAASGEETLLLLDDVAGGARSLEPWSAGFGSAAWPFSRESAPPFPPGQYDEHQQQIDLRPQNSWMLPFHEISLTEFLEVQIINVTAPFLLVSRLYPLLKRSACVPRFIINVSAVEGQFASAKLGSHIHTNMAKASLNMLTHTAAAGLASDQIFMNSVDPGWISQQSPSTRARNEKHTQPLLPLDLVDAAARVCDPIFYGITTGQVAAGQLYKDYQAVSW